MATATMLIGRRTELEAIEQDATASGTVARWGRVPRTFIRLTEDHTVPLALQDRKIADADALTPRNRPSGSRRS